MRQENKQLRIRLRRASYSQREKLLLRLRSLRLGYTDIIVLISNYCTYFYYEVCQSQAPVVNACYPSYLGG
jgi:hypothetical protein